MPQLTRKSAVAFKLEGTYGVNAAPTGAANAILVSGLEQMPLEQSLVSRDVIRPWLGNSDQLPVSANYMVKFNVELACHTTAGTPPAWGPLAQCCGMSQTDGGSTVTYALISDLIPSATIYVEIDGVLHKGTGCRGDMSIVMNAPGIPQLQFSFRGLFLPVVDGNITGVVYTAFAKPLPVNHVNTEILLMDSAGVVCKGVTLSLKNDYPYRDLIGYQGVPIVDRKPDGTISIEMEPVAARDWLGAIADGTTMPLSITHNVAAGRTVSIVAPAVQLTQPRYVTEQGVQMLQANLLLMPVSGNDELTMEIA